MMHDEEVRPVLLADIVECANMRMVQAADGTSLSLKALPALRVGRQLRGRNFDGNRAVQARVRRPIDLALPPRSGP
jgi:hypothetical protein